MARLLGVLVLIAAAVLGLGYYLGWFHFSSDRADNVTITLDRDKIRADEEKAKEEARKAGQKVKEETGALTGKAKEEAPKP
jgi:predicted negative regulator of RcsB-dependent stress response